MFHDKEDCCAIACCGICQTRRNRYLLAMDGSNDNLNFNGSNNSGSGSIYRVIAKLIVPIAVYSTVTTYIVHGIKPSDENDGEENSDENVVDPKTAQTLTLLTLLLFIYYVFMACTSVKNHVAFRRELRHRALGNYNAHGITLAHNRLMERSDTALHQLCCNYSFSHYEKSMINIDTDFCTKLWSIVASMCCGACCQCWCQCCGICATAQENRELKRILPASSFRIDYVTNQPWSEYNPQIDALRANYVTGMMAHFGAISKLSLLLLKSTAGVLLFYAALALTNIDAAFTWANMVVLIGTCIQSVIVLYAVHWYYCRMDISVDTVIKMFASGFIFSTSTAMVCEAIVSIIMQVVVGFLAVVLEYDYIMENNPNDAEADANGDAESSQSLMSKFGEDYPWIMGIFLFLNAFVVAAMVEELCKHFGFWMVSTPDMQRRVGDKEEDDEEQRADDDHCGSKQSHVSAGSAITVAMVAAATGFACCENLVYVFSYSGGTLGDEVGVLIARSLFPVHPICAAIQSIGVCRRDLEGSVDVKIGRILLPAIVLHGSFDFVLMLLGFIAKLVNHNSEDDAGDDAGIDVITVLSFVLSIAIVICAVIYYFVVARRQRARLMLLDGTHGGHRLIDQTII